MKSSHPLPSLIHVSALNPSQYLKHWLLSTKAAGVDGITRISDKTTTRTITAGIRAGQLRTNPETAGPDKQAQMLKMISALEGLHRTFNSTLSSRITIMPRGNDSVNMVASFTYGILKLHERVYGCGCGRQKTVSLKMTSDKVTEDTGKMEW